MDSGCGRAIGFRREERIYIRLASCGKEERERTEERGSDGVCCRRAAASLIRVQ